MSTISFKAKDELKRKLALIAEQKGINMSALIKLLLTEALEKELNRITENDLTVAEELAILQSDEEDEVFGPFETADEFMKSIEKNK